MKISYLYELIDLLEKTYGKEKMKEHLKNLYNVCSYLEIIKDENLLPIAKRAMESLITVQDQSDHDFEVKLKCIHNILFCISDFKQDTIQYCNFCVDKIISANNISFLDDVTEIAQNGFKKLPFKRNESRISQKNVWISTREEAMNIIQILLSIDALGPLDKILHCYISEPKLLKDRTLAKIFTSSENDSAIAFAADLALYMFKTDNSICYEILRKVVFSQASYLPIRRAIEINEALDGIQRLSQSFPELAKLDLPFDIICVPLLRKANSKETDSSKQKTRDKTKIKVDCERSSLQVN